MAAGMVALIMSAVAAVVWTTSGGRDRLRMILAALWGFAMSAAIGAYVLGALSATLGTFAKLFGA